MSEEKLNLIIEEDALKAMHAVANSSFPNQEVCILLSDPTCCGGLVQIRVTTLDEIKGFRDVSLAFDKDYKNHGIPVYIDNATLDDPIPNMLIILSSKEPIKFSFENADFYKK